MRYAFEVDSCRESEISSIHAALPFAGSSLVSSDERSWTAGETGARDKAKLLLEHAWSGGFDGRSVGAVVC